VASATRSESQAASERSLASVSICSFFELTNMITPGTGFALANKLRKYWHAWGSEKVGKSSSRRIRIHY
jgi:hypothetical protein